MLRTFAAMTLIALIGCAPARAGARADWELLGSRQVND